MAASAARLMCGPPPTLPRPDPSPTATTAISTPTNHRLDLPYPQVTKEEQKLQALKASSVSRRDMICLTAQTLTAATFWSADPAEARISRSEMRRKLMEKLEQLREKAGIAKPKGDDEKNPSLQPPSEKEDGLQTSTPSPNPLEDPVRTLVEAVFP